MTDWLTDEQEEHLNEAAVMLRLARDHVAAAGLNAQAGALTNQRDCLLEVVGMYGRDAREDNAEAALRRVAREADAYSRRDAA